MGPPPPWINPDIQSKMAWRESDVVISVPPKSGTTWTMNIVHQLREHGDRSFEDIYAEVTWCEAVPRPGATVEEMVKKLDDMPHDRPRAFKSHESPPTLPFLDDVKYVVVVRNPEEAIVSLKSFMAMHSKEFTEWFGVDNKRFHFPDFQTYFNAVVMHGRLHEKFFHFLKEWWNLRDKSNVLMLHYTDMVKDHEGSIRQISDFLGYGPYTDEEWETILELTSFQWMKKHETRFETRTVWECQALKQGAMVRQGSFGLARREGITEENAEFLAKEGRAIIENDAAFDWMYKGGELPSNSMENFADALHSSEEGKTIVASASKTFRGSSGMSAAEHSQLSFLISSPSICFGNSNDIKAVDDCFDKRNVDDGMLHAKTLLFINDATSTNNIVLYYWLAHFGGNPTGYVLLEGTTLDEDFKWIVIIENCDGDFIYKGPGSSKSSSATEFVKAVKKVVYGDKYCEED